MVENGNSRPNGIPSIESRIDGGRVYSVRRLDTGNANGDTFSIVIENPAESGVNLLTVAPQFSSAAKAFTEKIENPTIDTAGTSLTPRNKNLSINRTAESNAQFGGTGLTGTYSGGDSRGQVVTGSNQATSAGGVGRVDLSLRIGEGERVQYKMTSQAAGNDMSISAAYIEEPKTN